MTSLSSQLDAALPQTQCTRCGYPNCLAYAEAMAAGAAGIELCPPGGGATIRKLAELLGQSAPSSSPAGTIVSARPLAVIDELVCIGCRKCIDACPVDAIVGARKLMHTVLVNECSGCGLCLPPCPVDCIALVPATVAPDPGSLWPEYTRAETERWRTHNRARLARLAGKKSRRPRSAPAADQQERERMRAEIRAAVERVRARRAAKTRPA